MNSIFKKRNPDVEALFDSAGSPDEGDVRSVRLRQEGSYGDGLRRGRQTASRCVQHTEQSARSLSDLRCRSEKLSEQSRIFARKMKISDISEEFWRKEPAKFSDFAVGGRKSDRLLGLDFLLSVVSGLCR